MSGDSSPTDMDRDSETMLSSSDSSCSSEYAAPPSVLSETEVNAQIVSWLRKSVTRAEFVGQAENQAESQPESRPESSSEGEYEDEDMFASDEASATDGEMMQGMQCLRSSAHVSQPGKKPESALASLIKIVRSMGRGKGRGINVSSDPAQLNPAQSGLNPGAPARLTPVPIAAHSNPAYQTRAAPAQSAPAPKRASPFVPAQVNPAHFKPTSHAQVNRAQFNKEYQKQATLAHYKKVYQEQVNPPHYNQAYQAQVNPAHYNQAQVNPAHYNQAQVNPAHYNQAQVNPAHHNKAQVNPAHYNQAQVNPAHYNQAKVNPGHYKKAQVNPAHYNPASKNPARMITAHPKPTQVIQAEPIRIPKEWKYPKPPPGAKYGRESSGSIILPDNEGKVRVEGWLEKFPQDLAPEQSTNPPASEVDDRGEKLSSIEKPKKLQEKAELSQAGEQDQKSQGRESMATIQAPLKARFRELMASHPNGISAVKFTEKFSRAHGYYPDYLNLGCSSLDSLCVEWEDVFVVKKSPFGSPLLFPADIKDQLSHLSNLFQDAWEMIKRLVIKNGGVLRLEDIAGEMLATYNVVEDPLDWHSGDELAFFHYAFKKWPAPVFVEVDLDYPTKHILIRRNKKLLKSVEFDRRRAEKAAAEEAQRQEVSTALFLGAITFPDYCRLEDKAVCVGEELTAGRYYRCLAGVIDTPGHFYVRIFYENRDLEVLMATMQRHYQQTHKMATPVPKTLAVGLHVAVKRSVDGEWNRAVITGIKENGKYEVFMIDFGDTEVVTVDSLHYLKRDFLNQLKAQAVLCTAKLGTYYQKDIMGRGENYFDRGHGWNQLEGDLFRKIIHDQDLDLLVKFLKPAELLDKGEMSWLVFVHVLDPVTFDRIAPDGFHVERQVMKTVRKIYRLHQDDETDSQRRVSIVTRAEYITRQ